MAGKKVASHDIGLTVYERDAEEEGVDPSTDVPANYDPPNNTELKEFLENELKNRWPAYSFTVRSTSTDK